MQFVQLLTVLLFQARMVGCTYFGVMRGGLERNCWGKLRAATGVYAGGWVCGLVGGWFGGCGGCYMQKVGFWPGGGTVVRSERRGFFSF